MVLGYSGKKGRKEMYIERVLLKALSPVLVLCGLLYGSGHSKQSIGVFVDPRVELLCTIFRLAGNAEYTQNEVPKYIASIENHFKAFKDHPAIAMATELRKSRGIAYDAPMNLAVHLSEDYTLREFVSFDSMSADLDPRWKLDEVRKFLVLVRDFARQSNFKEFMQSHATLFEDQIKEMEKLLTQYQVRGWFQEYFGNSGSTDFLIIIGMQLGANNYGPRIRIDDEHRKVFAIKGVWQTDAKERARFGARDVETIVHEFCHSYANPIIETYRDILKEPAEVLYRTSELDMQRQSYGKWDAMLYKSLVRALVLRYISTQPDKGYHHLALEIEMKINGFIWIKELCQLLQTYENQRSHYPDLASFSSSIVMFFKEYARNIIAKRSILKNEESARWRHLEEKSPRIVSINPKDGDLAVDPNLREMTITFDRPVRGLGFHMFGRSTHYPILKEGAHFDSTGYVLTAPLRMQPNWYYIFGLNSERFLGFQDYEGNPLIPVVIRFKTRE